MSGDAYLQSILHVAHVLVCGVAGGKPPAGREEEALLHRQEGQQYVVLGHKARHLQKHYFWLVQRTCINVTLLAAHLQEWKFLQRATSQSLKQLKNAN